MMKKFSLVLSLATVAPTCFGTIAEARIRFEATHSEPFRHAVLVDAAAAPDNLRYEKASGKADFAFVLPYASDRRVRFVKASFDSGKFVAAQEFVLGFEPKALDVAAFEKLRDEQPMAAIRPGGDDIAPIALLYPARKVKPEYVVTDDLFLSVSPVPRMLGCLRESAGRLEIDVNKLAYRVTLVGKDGLAVDLGVAKMKEPVKESEVFQKVRQALEKQDPSRKGNVSDRDVVDWRHGSTVRIQAMPVK